MFNYTTKRNKQIKTKEMKIFQLRFDQMIVKLDIQY